MAAWKAGLLKKRDLEAKVHESEKALTMGRSELLTVEGPMSIEVMAQVFYLNGCTCIYEYVRVYVYMGCSG